MKFVTRFLIPRLIQWALLIMLGVTMLFFIPRLLPMCPVRMEIERLEKLGGVTHSVEIIEKMVDTMREMYGLEEGLLRQYITFWRRFLTLDFGPSIILFPKPVNELIWAGLPWTIGLVLTGLIGSWVLGIITGALTGYFRGSRLLKAIDWITIVIRPIPPYLVALLLLICFAFLIPIFPLRGAIPLGAEIEFSWSFITDVLYHAALPLLSIIVLGAAGMHQGMRLFVQTVKEEDHVRYAKLGSVNERTIFGRYVLRNALLPQVTGLSIGLAGVFGGSMITEMVFSYPGLGLLGLRAATGMDFNLMMGLGAVSITLLATALLIIDLLYPLVDPRIKLT